MTNEQKAVVIATYDGWEQINPDELYNKNVNHTISIDEMTDIYLNGSQWLKAIAKEALKPFGSIKCLDAGVDGAMAYYHLRQAVDSFKYDKKGDLHELFEATYEAIIFIVNYQNKSNQ